MISRRGLLTGLGALIAAPAIVRATSLMPVRAPLVISWDDATYIAYVHPSAWRDLVGDAVTFGMGCGIIAPDGHHLIRVTRLEAMQWRAPKPP